MNPQDHADPAAEADARPRVERLDAVRAHFAHVQDALDTLDPGFTAADLATTGVTFAEVNQYLRAAVDSWDTPDGTRDQGAADQWVVDDDLSPTDQSRGPATTANPTLVTDPWRAATAAPWTGPRADVAAPADLAPWEGESQWPDAHDLPREAIAEIDAAARVAQDYPGRILLRESAAPDDGADYTAALDCDDCQGTGLVIGQDPADLDHCPCVTVLDQRPHQADDAADGQAQRDQVLALDDALVADDDDLAATSCRCCGGEFSLPVDDDVDMCTTCAEGEREFDETSARAPVAPDQVDGVYLDDAYVFTTPEHDSPWGTSTTVPPADPATEPWRAPAATPRPLTATATEAVDEAERLDQALRSAEAACDRIDAVLADNDQFDRVQQVARWCADDRAATAEADVAMSREAF